jgi:hypothetical protein
VSRSPALAAAIRPSSAANDFDAKPPEIRQAVRKITYNPRISFILPPRSIPFAAWKIDGFPSLSGHYRALFISGPLPRQKQTPGFPSVDHHLGSNEI